MWFAHRIVGNDQYHRHYSVDIDCNTRYQSLAFICQSYYAPAQGLLSDDDVWRLTSVCLSSVCRVHSVGGRRVRPAGWDGAYWLIGPGLAGLAQGCRCALPLQAWAGGILWRPPAQLVVDRPVNSAS